MVRPTAFEWARLHVLEVNQPLLGEFKLSRVGVGRVVFGCVLVFMYIILLFIYVLGTEDILCNAYCYGIQVIIISLVLKQPSKLSPNSRHTMNTVKL